MAEFHPYAFLLAEDSTPDSLRIGFPYFMHGVPARFDEPGDYADPEATQEHTVTFEWLHGFAEIIDPLLRRGLRLDFLHELPYTVPGLPFSFLEKDESGMLRVKEHHEDFPLTFTLRMTKEDAMTGADARMLGDEDLLAILEEAIADERAAQEKYREGLARCADPEACERVRAAAARGARPRARAAGALRGGQEAHRPARRRPRLTGLAEAGGSRLAAAGRARNISSHMQARSALTSAKSERILLVRFHSQNC